MMSRTVYTHCNLLCLYVLLPFTFSPAILETLETLTFVSLLILFYSVLLLLF